MSVCTLGELLSKQNKCLEQTLDLKKIKVRVSVCLHFVLFSLSQIWGVQYKQESHVSPTWPYGLKVKNSRRPELIRPASPPLPPHWKSNACPPVMVAWNSTAQTSQQSIQGRVGLRSCALTLLHVLFSSMLMTVKPQRPPASICQVLTQPLFTQAHNKSTTFLGGR